MYVYKMGTEKQKTIWERFKHPMLGKHHRKESLEKMSKTKTGVPNFKLRETIKKLGINKKENNPFFGKHHSEETKRKIRLFKLGKKQTEETKRKLSKIMKGRKFSDEHRKNMSETRKRLIRENKIVLPNGNTSIEVKIQNFLKELGIEFITHQYMHIEHGYQCDIYIPDMNLVIEADGDYWHNYPNGNEVDHIRNKELEKKGFKVLRLWGSEIREMNLDKFKLHLNKNERRYMRYGKIFS